MRGLAAGGAGFSVVAMVLAIASFRQVRGDEPGEGKRQAIANSGELDAAPVAAAAASAVDPWPGGERLVQSYRDLYGDGQPFRSVIVLAPDPVEMGGTELFDLVLEGVEEAVSSDQQRVGAYVRDHQWLPWADGAALA